MLSNLFNKFFNNEEKITYFETDKGMKAKKIQKGFKSVVFYDLKGYREKIKEEKKMNQKISIPIEIIKPSVKQELKVNFR